MFYFGLWNNVMNMHLPSASEHCARTWEYEKSPWPLSRRRLSGLIYEADIKKKKKFLKSRKKKRTGERIREYLVWEVRFSLSLQAYAERSRKAVWVVTGTTQTRDGSDVFRKQVDFKRPLGPGEFRKKSRK